MYPCALVVKFMILSIEHLNCFERLEHFERSLSRISTHFAA